MGCNDFTFSLLPAFSMIFHAFFKPHWKWTSPEINFWLKSADVFVFFVF